MPLDGFTGSGLEVAGAQFDEMHTQLFTFALDADKEVVNLRAVVHGKATDVVAEPVESGAADAAAAAVGTQSVYVDQEQREATIYDRAKLCAGNRVHGPAIVTEMDATSLILPGHTGEIDAFGNILINPDAS